jgi:hypothetical protein
MLQRFPKAQGPVLDRCGSGGACHGSAMPGFEYGVFGVYSGIVELVPHVMKPQKPCQQHVTPVGRPALRCPECAGVLAPAGGCFSCPICGWARCG